MDFSMLITTLGAAKDMAGALVGERDRQKAAVIEVNLTEKILQAQAQLAQVLAAVIEKDAAIRTLGERVRELEAAQNERARYQLARLGSVGNFFAYRLRAAAELGERADEPQHFLCQPCFDAGKKSVLRIGPIRGCLLPVQGPVRCRRALLPRRRWRLQRWVDEQLTSLLLCRWGCP